MKKIYLIQDFNSKGFYCGYDKIYYDFDLGEGPEYVGKEIKWNTDITLATQFLNKKEAKKYLKKMLTAVDYVKTTERFLKIEKFYIN